MRVRLSAPLGDRQFQPVINGEDVHLVPLGQGEYGVAATVEFPPDSNLPTQDVQPDPEALDRIWQRAIAYCPGLAAAEVLETWYGRRPRPQGQAAPVIQPLAGYGNVMLATGHYRNGVFLAPATAAIVADWVRGV
jgi:glycine oxidase